MYDASPVCPRSRIHFAFRGRRMSLLTALRVSPSSFLPQESTCMPSASTDSSICFHINTVSIIMNNRLAQNDLFNSLEIYQLTLSTVFM